MDDLYVEFRSEIDRMAFPLICKIKGMVVKEIFDDGEAVGFLMVENGYIDSLYVREGHRRKGLARKAVLEYVEEYGLPNTLRIIKTNTAAKRFWKSIFEMTMIDRNEVDYHYLIRGMK